MGKGLCYWRLRGCSSRGGLIAGASSIPPPPRPPRLPPPPLSAVLFTRYPLSTVVYLLYLPLPTYFYLLLPTYFYLLLPTYLPTYLLKKKEERRMKE